MTKHSTVTVRRHELQTMVDDYLRLVNEAHDQDVARIHRDFATITQRRFWALLWLFPIRKTLSPDQAVEHAKGILRSQYNSWRIKRDYPGFGLKRDRLRVIEAATEVLKADGISSDEFTMSINWLAQIHLTMDSAIKEITGAK